MFDAQPDSFGSYRVLDTIGAGRFGPVYRAQDEASGAPASIEVFDQALTAEQAGALVASLERLCAAPLDHPSILAPVAAGLDAGTSGGRRPWLAEPWFEGLPLDEVMRQGGPQALADVILRLTQVAAALDFAAAAGLHHGALHPRDILVSEEATRLTGIGVLQALAEAGLEVPMAGAYVSPQRAAGLPSTSQDDIYALAAITYELIYGRPVPPYAELRQSIVPLTGVDTGRLGDLLLGSLAPEPAERPAMALHFAAALQRTLVDEPAAVVVPDAEPLLTREPPVPVNEVELPLYAAEAEPEPPLIRPPAVVPPPRLLTEPEAVASGSTQNTAFAVAAALAIGIMAGFAGGFVVGQRDATPVPHSAERVSVRGEGAAASGRSSADDRSEQAARPQVQAPAPREPERVERQEPIPVERPGQVEEPAPSAAVPADTPGALQVDSRPRGAQVFVDGRLVGKTPLSLPDVEPGPHAVRIDLIGYQRWVAAVHVAPGSRQRVAASLLMDGER